MMPYVWLTHPHYGVEYFAVPKEKTSFGFAPEKVFRHEILSPDANSIYLRSIDAIGTGGPLFLISFASEQNSNHSILFRTARIADEDTGSLDLLPARGFAIPEVSDIRDSFVVTAKPGTDEFWVTDGTLSLWNLRILDDGSVGLKMKMTLPEVADVRGKETKLAAIQKIQFFDQADSGVVKLRAEDGREFISMFYLYSVQVAAKEPAPDDGQLNLFEIESVEPSVDVATSLVEQEQMSIDFDFARQVRPGALRMSVDPGKQLIYLSYSEEVVVYYYSIEAEQIRMLKRVKIDDLAPGYWLLGAEITRTATPREIETKDGPQTILVNPQSKLALILENKSTGEVKIDWN